MTVRKTRYDDKAVRTCRLRAVSDLGRFLDGGREGRYRCRCDVVDLIRSGCTLLPAYDFLSAATDPSGSDNYTRDYSVGSRWLNTTASRAWTCLAAATGAAVWVFDGMVPGVSRRLIC